MYEPVKEETKEQYLKVWLHYSVGHLSQEQLAKLFECSVDTVANAIKWCAENRVQFSNHILAESAKESLENRIRELNNDLVRIKQSTPINWNAVIGINRLITENEGLLLKLQNVIQDRSVITIQSTQVNQVLKARDEIIEGMSDAERAEIISSIRAVVSKRDDNQEGTE